jgi:hypothetical protein
MEEKKKLFVQGIILGNVICISTEITVPGNLILEKADHILLGSSQANMVVSVSLL